jgi:thiosulfate dehydrogenase [quinone] large subunit
MMQFLGVKYSRGILLERKKRLMFNQWNVPFRWGTIIVVLAGVWTIVHLIWNVAGVQTDDYWGIALPILFLLALILAFVQYSQERSALQAVPSTERFPEPAITRFFLASEESSDLWFVVRMYVGAEWLLAGWEKVTSPVWGASGKALAGFAAGALAKSSGANPAVQGWYAWFLQHIVLPNAGLFSFLVTWGEVAVGVGILLGILTGIAAGFGVLMNLNYLLAGTVSINPVLGVLGLFLCISWRVCGWIGFDQWLLPALGLPWKPGTWFGSQEPAVTAPRS